MFNHFLHPWLATAPGGDFVLALGLSIMSVAIPPLTDEQSLRLETAADGYDVREEAFFALIENARLWTGEVRDEPVRLKPDFEVMLAEPERFRGDLCLIQGWLVQQAVLEAPYSVAREWFVRDQTGRAVAVYIVGLDEVDGASFRDGDPVRVYARFYKRMDEVARDGVRRSYPAFVGAHPESMIPPARGGATGLWIVLLPVLTLLGVFAILFAYIREQKRRARAEQPRRPVWEAGGEVEEAALPDDPADALAELKRRQSE